MKTTSTQPELAKTRIYGSTHVEPMDSANQPEVLPHTKVHGVKTTATVTVRLKNSDEDGELVIGEADFDASKHERVIE